MSISIILKNLGMCIILASIIVGAILSTLTFLKLVLLPMEILHILALLLVSGIVIALIGTLLERYEEEGEVNNRYSTISNLEHAQQCLHLL